MNFFIEQGENAMNPEGAISGIDVYSEEARKLSWTRVTRIRLFMKMELEACRNDLTCMVARIRHCLLISSPYYITYLERRVERAKRIYRHLLSR